MATRIPASRHEYLVKCLYKSLLRGLCKTKCLVPVIDINMETDEYLLPELKKASIDVNMYRDFLVSELRYYIDEKIRKRPRSSIDMYLSIMRGDHLSECLEKLPVDASKAEHWHEVIRHLVYLRDELFKKQKWKKFYSENQKQIDEQRSKDLPLKISRRLASVKNPHRKGQTPFRSLKANEQLKEYKKAMVESKEDAGFVVRNYLKRLQLEGRIPNPYKLPFVSKTLTLQSANLPNPNVLLPGSTKSFVIEQAYDAVYIEAVIKPEVEYLINQSIMNDTDFQMNEKGPQRAKIHSTNAGIMTVHFLGAQFSPHSVMKNIAMDIKKLTRLYKLRHVWNVKATNKTALAHEKKVDEGYAVKGSGGYSDDEVICTKEYYQNLADTEASWEALIDDLRDYDKFGKMRPVRRKASLYRQEWREALDISSAYIETELRSICTKYKLLEEIFSEQDRVQKALQERYEERSQRYARLVEMLEKDKVFMHSELINFRNPVTHGLDDYLEADSNKQPQNKQGLPQMERLGMGKTLGDYLRIFKFSNYRMGQRYRKRFKFK